MRMPWRHSIAACAASLICLIACRAPAAAAFIALAGSASRMIDLIRTLVRIVEIPLYEAVTMATQNPARVIGLTNKGRLAAGADADLVVLSPELDVLRTFSGGDEIFSLEKE